MSCCLWTDTKALLTANCHRLRFSRCSRLIGEVRVVHKFEIYKDKAGEFRVRFKYNSEIMFSTEGYSSKAGAQNAIDSIKKNGPGAPTEDNA